MQFPIRVIPRIPAEKVVQIYHPYAFLKEKSELKGPSLLALFTADRRGSAMLVIWERYLLSQCPIGGSWDNLWLSGCCGVELFLLVVVSAVTGFSCSTFLRDEDLEKACFRVVTVSAVIEMVTTPWRAEIRFLQF